MPNFILIRPPIWISIGNTQTHRQTDIALYVLDSTFSTIGKILFGLRDSMKIEHCSAALPFSSALFVKLETCRAKVCGHHFRSIQICLIETCHTHVQSFIPNVQVEMS